MNSFEGLGKVLLIGGLIVAAVGGILVLLPKIPWIGKLPGDIFYKGEKVTVYFPLMTCLVISILISLILAIFRK